MAKHKSKRINKSEEEIFQSFLEQVNFLITAANLYDNGNRPAIKMATSALRTLFYKQRYGPILIDQISDVNKSKFISTVEYVEGSIIYMGPVEISHVLNKLTNKITPIYLPSCYSGPDIEHFLSFDRWWNGKIFISQGDSFTRLELVRFIANQDGGSHVDDGLEEKYYKMVHNALSMTINPGNLPVEELNLALIRQVIHETLISFKKMHLPNIEYDSGKKSYNATHLQEPISFTHFSFAPSSTNQKTLYN